MELAQAQEYVRSAMPRLLNWHAKLISHASVAFPGYPKEPMEAIVPDLLAMFNEFGVPAEVLDIPGGYPAIWAEIPGPEGSPTVLLYAHYDVQPCPASQDWKTDPWTATVKEDGRIYGRGAADVKGGLMTIVGGLGAFAGKFPCTIKVCIEGEEETASHLEEFVEANPEKFAADIFLIADSGPEKVGKPSVCTGLRGVAATTISLQTLESALHSGLYGGAAPDAVFVLLRLLNKMFDDEGNTIIPGLHEFDWGGEDIDEAQLRANANVPAHMTLQGSGPIKNRLWARPNATIIGIDGVPVDECANALNPTARARISMRLAPGANPERELATLKKFLVDNAPLGAKIEFSNEQAGSPFKAIDGPHLAAAKAALEEAYGVAAEELGSGGAIPLCNVLRETKAGSEVIIWGVQDEEFATIHGPNESVHPDEIERITVATIRLLSQLAK